MSRTTIRSITVETLNIPLLEPFTIATGSVSDARNVLITITLDDGSVGYGESAPFPPSTGESQETAEEVRRQAVEAFLALDLSGLARVDFFIEKETEQVYINEVNTLPGFTTISMFPKLWEASGLPYAQLMDRLIELAIERHADRQRNRTSL